MEATNLIHMESFVILRMLYKWNPTECNFLGLDKFIQCNSVEIHLGFVVSVVLFLNTHTEVNLQGFQFLAITVKIYKTSCARLM